MQTFSRSVKALYVELENVRCVFVNHVSEHATMCLLLNIRVQALAQMGGNGPNTLHSSCGEALIKFIKSVRRLQMHIYVFCWRVCFDLIRTQLRTVIRIRSPSLRVWEVGL